MRGRTVHALSDVRYGFMPERGTRHKIVHIIALEYGIIRRYTNIVYYYYNKVYVCLINYSKAFDTVKHESLIQVLQSLDVDAQR